MNISRQRLRRPPAVLPDEVIVEIISWLPVKPLIRFRSVNKSFNSLISDPHFIQMHLKKSARNPHLTLMSQQNSTRADWGVVTIPVSRLLENLRTTIYHDLYYRLTDNVSDWWVVGSCNGLLCLTDIITSPCRQWLSFWNPATGEFSECYFFAPSLHYLEFSFGYDNSTQTYKVVASRMDLKGDNARSMVKVFSLGDTLWREIQCFPVLPLHKINSSHNNGVHLCGTINWLALRDYFGLDYSLLDYSNITIDQYVILSLDLSTETYTQFLLPQGFDKVPHYRPTLVVLMNSLCFCHDFDGTHFVIWQLKNFGVHGSWIQLYKISYKNLFSTREFKCLDLLPLYLSENGDTLILTSDEDDRALIYNCRDNTVEKTRITNKISWSWVKDYVESLVSPC